jgi:hypothetical protein
MRNCLIPLVVCAAGAALAGCSSESEFPMGHLSGVVLIDAEPFDLDADLMFFDPSTGQAVSAAIKEHGDFEVAEPVRVGTYTVYLAPKASLAEGAEPAPVTIDSTLPDKYWNEATSDLKVTVSEGGEDKKVSIIFEKG